MNLPITEAEFSDSAVLGAPEDIARSPWVVLKFGGTSVSSAESWATIAGLVRNRLAAELKPVVVHSALQGVSNKLLAALQAAAAGERTGLVAEIREQHYELARQLGVDGPALLNETLHELEQLIAGVRLVREVSVRVHVRIMALGELMATRLGAEYLDKVGIPVEWLDARDLLISVSSGGGQRSRDYLSAKCASFADAAMQERLAASGKVILTQGFIARNEWGETVILGRGGSDTSAAYFDVMASRGKATPRTDCRPAIGASSVATRRRTGTSGMPAERTLSSSGSGGTIRPIFESTARS